eukprot:CAMPEP_0195047438 /NCGR_PEP_ID=MMETSP0347-20130606/36503_1 /TAXON_ID=2932 /ORGANISM="Alexandrium fundyense, Strain CCMP1719" /LENGTH=47 /DNA_ID= /DNA_START= /DNA_END= /DNA_ORIENTATION=
MELEKVMREFQSAYQEKLFLRVSGITDSMLSMCQGTNTNMKAPTPTA